MTVQLLLAGITDDRPAVRSVAASTAPSGLFVLFLAEGLLTKTLVSLTGEETSFTEGHGGVILGDNLDFFYGRRKLRLISTKPYKVQGDLYTTATLSVKVTNDPFKSEPQLLGPGARLATTLGAVRRMYGLELVPFLTIGAARRCWRTVRPN